MGDSRGLREVDVKQGVLLTVFALLVISALICPFYWMATGSYWWAALMLVFGGLAWAVNGKLS